MDFWPVGAKNPPLGGGGLLPTAGERLPQAGAAVQGQLAQAQPAPQPPKGPAVGAAAGAGPADEDRPTEAKTDKSRVVSTWPCGQEIGLLASDIDRRASKRLSQVRQRYSYTGIELTD